MTPRPITRLRPLAGAALAALLAVAASGTLTACRDSTVARGDTLIVRAGDWQTLPVGGVAGQPLVVKAQSVAEVGIPGDTIRWHLETPGGRLSDSLSVTGADGTASTIYHTSNTAITTIVRATHRTGIVQFSVIQRPLAASGIQALSGNGSAAAVGHPITLTAKVVDQHGNGVQDVMVSWSTDGGSLRTTSSRSDFLGHATAILDVAARGQIRVTVSAPGLGQAVFLIDGV